MRITFDRTMEMELTGLEVASSVIVHDLAEALGNGAATFKYDDREDVYVITRLTDGEFLGSFEELQLTAAGAIDSNFVAHA